MKKALIALVLGAILPLVSAQEHLPRTEALQYAFLVSTDLSQLLGTPIPTDVDLKRVVAMRDGDYGAMVLPEAKLSAETFAKAGDKFVPVGQLWLHKLTPMRNYWGVPNHELRLASVPYDEGVATVPQCALGVRRNDGKMELGVFGNSKEPLLVVPLKPVQAKQQQPVEMSAERTDDGGRITLRFLGQYEASLMVTEL